MTPPRPSQSGVPILGRWHVPPPPDPVPTPRGEALDEDRLARPVPRTAGAAMGHCPADPGHLPGRLRLSAAVPGLGAGRVLRARGRCLELPGRPGAVR